ncbi:hypothetical protein BPTFM16_00150 [Altererythrobacter insulae]|nr:hypothetical protein BPTFM16_00150 [Altererythrobacter insulae]
MLSAICCSCLALSVPLQAQSSDEEAPVSEYPETDIFLFDYDPENSDNALSGGRNVTNQPRYDNQPFFTADSETFLYSRDDGTQTDIWEYDIATGRHTQITSTPVNEYSPTPSPDNQTISMVSEQFSSIAHLDRDTSQAPEWSLGVTEVEEPVGYFARNYQSGDIVFWSRYGFNVTLINIDEPGFHFISGDAVPVAPRVIPGTDQFSFVHRQTNEEVWIKAFDPKTKSIRPLTTIVGSNANHDWAPDGSVLLIEGSSLYRWREGGEGWEEVGDFSDAGIASANRIAVSPDGDHIAIVGLPAD